MRTKHWISLGLITAVLIASLLILNASTPKKQKATCCKKATKECSGDIKSDAPAGTALENLSHQFILLPVFLH